MTQDLYVDWGRDQMVFSFQLKSRPDLQLYLQEKKENEGGGYYVMMLSKTTSNSFPPPGQQTYHYIGEIEDFLNGLVEWNAADRQKEEWEKYFKGPDQQDT